MSRNPRQPLFIFAVVLVLALVLSACNANAGRSNTAQVPAGRAYAEGKEIFFAHTETSDPGIAETLTNMMQSPVLHVPSLANVPLESTSPVYVFANGVTGSGPLGFQPDVFDNPPGTPGYTPLRQIHVVTWADGATARELKSAAEVTQAADAGELTIEPNGVIVNMPFMVWDGGQR